MEEFRHFVYYAVMLGSHQCTVAEAEQCVIGIMSETRDVSIVPGRPPFVAPCANVFVHATHRSFFHSAVILQMELMTTRIVFFINI